jgi:hypothetical protein
VLAHFKAPWTEEFRGSKHAKRNLAEFDYEPDNPPDAAPFIDTHYVSGTFGKYEGRGVRYPVQGLARACGFSHDFVFEHFGW